MDAFLAAVNLVVLLVGGLMLRNYLASYMDKKGEGLATKEDIREITAESERGKNLATKEDIQEITAKVEEVRLGFGSRLHVSRIRYEREFDTLYEISAALAGVCRAAKVMRPVFSYRFEDETEEDRSERLLGAYYEAANGLRDLAEFRKPFYPEEIYKVLTELNQVAWIEARDYSEGGNEDDAKDGYWQRAEKNAAEIDRLAEEAMGAIRKRVEEWEHATEL